MIDPVSAAELARDQLKAFLASHRRTCTCSPIELRAEGGRLVCAACGSSILEVKK